MSRITQADVVRAAIKQLSKRGGYTPNDYFKPKVGDVSPGRPGPNVGATCAIGGVEQAIWTLTGEVVAPDYGYLVRSRLAQRAEPELRDDDTPRQRLYAGIMRRLNAKARKLFPELDGEKIETVEEVTFHGGKAVSRRRTLEVFAAVLADLDPCDSNRDPGDETAAA